MSSNTGMILGMELTVSITVLRMRTCGRNFFPDPSLGKAVGILKFINFFICFGHWESRSYRYSAALIIM